MAQQMYLDIQAGEGTPNVLRHTSREWHMKMYLDMQGGNDYVSMSSCFQLCWLLFKTQKYTFCTKPQLKVYSFIALFDNKSYLMAMFKGGVSTYSV